jgi:hypothetical protein
LQIAAVARVAAAEIAGPAIPSPGVGQALACAPSLRAVQHRASALDVATASRALSFTTVTAQRAGTLRRGDRDHGDRGEVVGRRPPDAREAVGDVAWVRDEIVAVTLVEIRTVAGSPPNRGERLVVGAAADAIRTAAALRHDRIEPRCGPRDLGDGA